MQEEKNAQPGDTSSQRSTNDERLAEATSSETLSDIRADEKFSDKNPTTRDVASTPAPDGTGTTTPGSTERADGSNTGEPM